MPMPNLSDKSTPNPEPKGWLNGVAVTAAVLAAMAAVSSLLSTRNTNEAMIDQINAADQWAFFQAKSMKAAILESKIELMGPLGKPVDPADPERVERYKREQGEARAAAEGHQRSADERRRKASRFAAASTASQIGIAMTAIALLTKKRLFWVLVHRPDRGSDLHRARPSCLIRLRDQRRIPRPDPLSGGPDPPFCMRHDSPASHRTGNLRQ